ncbi:4-hydroxy-3-methylbut-2-enyl diphosphate reductase [Chitinivibrio alkaliphilus]|uniref:4-hydroxy-3-methylbut-2-enyl diphosphate reductase n=1 Tax=Chitinivibrio alkaliphilus ACht1 TaxID=1313304 RepID=U7D9E4_9BACT|nr:4-hydroxy-3-methylbut-2-enyl diphosphate reductase [Chitinivibrio alkaliphilus]ERP31712.1 hydroxymethylbutenyl pyrophosphate reductase [Chitinivibrio alkaliphilus ACht1]
MNIIVAKTAGFCMGVERAVRLALTHSDNGEKRLYTPGPLIHNTQAITMLEQNNIKSLTDDTSPEDKSILIRAHGIPPEKEAEFARQGCTIIDGTCPMVKKVHRVIQKYIDRDFTIVITGDKDHAETRGLMGYAKERGILINSPQEVAKIPSHSHRLCIVSQTTFSVADFDAIVEEIFQTFPEREIAVEKTICKATSERQNEVISLRDITDMMIVVGGKHSANTLRLAEIAGEKNKRVLHIEDADELNPLELKGVENLGITAGASTPGWVIQDIVEKIEKEFEQGESS